MCPVATIIAAGNDTRLGGVERFATMLSDALCPDWSTHIVSPEGRPPRNLERLGARELWMALSASRRVAIGPRSDIIISNGTLGWGSPRDVPRIHVFHGTMAGYALATRRLPRRVRAGLGGAAAEWLSGRRVTCVAVSHAVASQARRYYGIRVHRVIENGVDVGVFHPRDRGEARRRLGVPMDRRLALFVGRPEPGKGPEVAAAAAREAGALLLSAGPRPVAGAQHLGLLSPDQLAWAYAAADCVLLPTTYEGCAFTVLEALASGRPVITTRTGWTRDLATRLPEYRPLLVAPRVNDVARAIIDLDAIATPPLLEAARSLVIAGNSLERFVAQWHDLCIEVIGNRSVAVAMSQ